MDHLVDTDWLADNHDRPGVVVIDCTVYSRRGEKGFEFVSGREAYDSAHIPGARFGDLTEDLADTNSQWNFAVPEPAAFADAMANLGVSDDSTVILYDDAGMMWAARVWWMLRWIGFDRAAILDGGMVSWRAEDLPTTDEVPEITPGSLSVSVRPELIADKARVLEAVGDNVTCLIDALPEPVFQGEMKAYKREGHIAGATNTPAMSLIDQRDGRLLPLEDLRERFPEAGPIITYCGGGIAASLDAFVLTLLGRDDVAVYTTSLQEWTQDPDTPMEK